MSSVIICHPTQSFQNCHSTQEGLSACQLSVTCRLDTSCSARQFWNYQRRQLYVMDTYCNAHNRRLNHIMLALHCYLSWAFVIALVLTGLELITALTWSAADTQVSSGDAHTALRFGHWRRHFSSSNYGFVFFELFVVSVYLYMQDTTSGHVSVRLSMPARAFLAAFAFAHLALWLLAGKSSTRSDSV